MYKVILLLCVIVYYCNFKAFKALKHKRMNSTEIEDIAFHLMFCPLHPHVFSYSHPVGVEQRCEERKRGCTIKNCEAP